MGYAVETIDSLTMGAAPPAPAASTLAAPQQWFVNWATGNPGGEPGPAVNEFTAYSYLAVYQCVSLIVGKIAELPLETIRDDGRTRKPAADRAERPLLLNEFNPAMSAMTARETGNGHLLTWGNSYTQIVRNKSGSRVLGLYPQGPDVVKVRRGPGGGLLYDVHQRGTGRLLDTLEAKDVIHVPGFGFDGLVGYSPIRVARTAIRSGMAQDRQAEKYITRGIRPPGAIQFPEGHKFGSLQEAIEYRDNFKRLHSAADGDLNVAILEDGATWQQLGIDPKSAQLLDSRKYSRKEICGIYRVPPFLIGDIESSTSWGTGVAQQMQNFVDYCLLTWMRRNEVEYKRKLAPDDPHVFYRHCTEEMLRGDFAARTEALDKQHKRGVITDNEWRRIENLNPVEGGDVRHVPLNEVLVDAAGEIVPLPAPTAGGRAGPPAPKPADDTAAALAPKLRAVAVGVVGRCLRKEAAEARKAAARPDRFVAWVDEFYAARHLTQVRDNVAPVVEAWVTAFPRGTPATAEDFAARHVERSRLDLLDAADGDPAGFAARVERVAARWEAERLADVAGEFTEGKS